MNLFLIIPIFLLTFLCFFVHTSNGLKCYVCSLTENDADRTCADDVTKMGSSAIIDCNKKYCTIMRLEYLDPKGKLHSFGRNCDDVVPADGIVEDSTLRVYSRSCKTDLCNSGSGKTDSNDGIRALGDKSIIYAPGTGRSSTSKIYLSLITLTVSIVISTINNNN